MLSRMKDPTDLTSSTQRSIFGKGVYMYILYIADSKSHHV